MYCQDCGVEVPQDSVFCQHCGARLPEAPDTGAGRRPGTRTFLGDPADPSAYVTPTSGSIPGMPPYAGPPPTGESSGSRSGNSTPQPRRAGGNRTLLIAVVVAVALFMLAVPLGLMALLTTTRESSGTSDPVSVSSGEDTVTTAPSDGDSTSSTSGSGPPGSGSTQGVAPDYASSDWEELELPGLPEQTYSAITSDVAAAFETKSGLYAYIYETGKLVHLPTEMNAASSVSIDGDRMVWWEGDYDESDTLTREGIFSYRLPDGPRVELLTGGESAGSPLLSDGYVTWLEGRESADHPQDIWELPIYGAALDAGGRLQGEPQSLVENPRSYVLGDSTWSYDLTPDYLAWEDNDPADGSQPGTWVLDRRTGTRTFIGPLTRRPSISGTSIAFIDEDGLSVRDLVTNEGGVVDPEGDWATLTPRFMAYLRPDYQGDTTTAWSMVTLGTDGRNERVVGRQASPPWFGSSPSASPGHLAFVGADGVPHVFELQPR